MVCSALWTATRVSYPLSTAGCAKTQTRMAILGSPGHSSVHPPHAIHRLLHPRPMLLGLETAVLRDRHQPHTPRCHDPPPALLGPSRPAFEHVEEVWRGCCLHVWCGVSHTVHAWVCHLPTTRQLNMRDGKRVVIASVALIVASLKLDVTLPDLSYNQRYSYPWVITELNLAVVSGEAFSVQSSPVQTTHIQRDLPLTLQHQPVSL